MFKKKYMCYFSPKVVGEIALGIFAGCLLPSCGGETDAQKAAILLSQAQNAFETAQYNDAKVLLDSIEQAYPREVAVRKQGNLLQYKVQLSEMEKTIQYTDSMITVFNEMQEDAVKDFSFQKTEYEEMGHYIYHGTETEKNGRQSYIRATVDEYGIIQLISTYCGAPIGHTALQVNATDGTQCTTTMIPYNDGGNYRYEVDGYKYEVVTYTGEQDGGVLGFIEMHADDKKLTATFVGGQKEKTIVIAPRDIKALCASAKLGQFLASKLKLQQENKVATGKVDYLKQMIARKEMQISEESK